MRNNFTTFPAAMAATLFCLAAAPMLPAQETTTQPQKKVGMIYVVGNEVTQDQVILGALGLSPGQPFRDADVRAAEANLKKLGIFEDSSNHSPSVEVIENRDSDSPYHDIIARVRETQTGTLKIFLGMSTRGQVFVRVILEERNFDPHRYPTSWIDVTEGRAFRGAGKKLKFEAFPITVRTGLQLEPLVKVLSPR